MTARRRRTRASRGVAILEMAVVAPFLLLFLFGISEFGLAWVSGNRLEGAVSTAARTASSSGSVADADRNILLALRAALPSDLRDNATRVVVYESNADGDINDSCLSNSPGNGVSGACNIYGGDRLRTVTATTNLGSEDDFWAPATREDRLSGPPDYIGVLVLTSHDDITGTFWDDFDLERRSVYRIAPDIDG